MKINVNGKEVSLIVNGEAATELVKKAKLSEKGLSPDQIVRNRKEELAKAQESQNGDQE